jgi:Ca2+:H+ antiporter
LDAEARNGANAMILTVDLSMGIAVGSCTQISLFVVPLAVIFGWIMDKDMTLNFPQFEGEKSLN